MTEAVLLLDSTVEDAPRLQVQSLKYLIQELAVGDQVLQLLTQQAWVHVLELLDGVVVAQLVDWLQSQRQRRQRSGDLAHDDLDEVALVDQVAHELGVDAQGIEAHHDHIVQEVLLALREHAFGVLEVVHQDVKGKANVVRDDVFHDVLVANGTGSACTEEHTGA